MEHIAVKSKTAANYLGRNENERSVARSLANAVRVEASRPGVGDFYRPKHPTDMIMWSFVVCLGPSLHMCATLALRA